MSRFWATWVIVRAALNIGLVCVLFVGGQIVKIPTELDGTTGHVWAHGVLRESVRKLPWWWVVYSLIGVAGCFGYLYLFRVAGWSSVADLQRDTVANQQTLEATLAPLRGLSLSQLASNSTATSIGHRLYLDNCAACHGQLALGNPALGAPNL